MKCLIYQLALNIAPEAAFTAEPSASGCSGIPHGRTGGENRRNLSENTEMSAVLTGPRNWVIKDAV